MGEMTSRVAAHESSSLLARPLQCVCSLSRSPATALPSLSRRNNRFHIDARNYIPVATYLQPLQDFTFPEQFRFRAVHSGQSPAIRTDFMLWVKRFWGARWARTEATTISRMPGGRVSTVLYSPTGCGQYGEHCRRATFARQEFAVMQVIALRTGNGVLTTGS